MSKVILNSKWSKLRTRDVLLKLHHFTKNSTGDTNGNNNRRIRTASMSAYVKRTKQTLAKFQFVFSLIRNQFNVSSGNLLFHFQNIIFLWSLLNEKRSNKAKQQKLKRLSKQLYLGVSVNDMTTTVRRLHESTTSCLAVCTETIECRNDGICVAYKYCWKNWNRRNSFSFFNFFFTFRSVRLAVDETETQQVASFEFSAHCLRVETKENLKICFWNWKLFCGLFATCNSVSFTSFMWTKIEKKSLK